MPEPSSFSPESLLKWLKHLLVTDRQTDKTIEEFGNLLEKLEKRKAELKNHQASIAAELPLVSFELLLKIVSLLRWRWEKLLEKNKALSRDLQQARSLLKELAAKTEKLRQQVIALCSPPFQLVPFVQWEKWQVEGTEICGARFKLGQTLRVAPVDNSRPDLIAKLQKTQRGQMLRLNSLGAITDVLEEYEKTGEMFTVAELLPDGQLRVIDHTGAKSVALVSGAISTDNLKSGDQVLISNNGLAVEKISSIDLAREHFLQKLPTVSWSDIGGLDKQILELRDELERHLIYPAETKLFRIPPLKGVLLHGPPGTGKTMMVKAAVGETAKVLSQALGREVPGRTLLINGPGDILNMYVGSSEGKLKNDFAQAKAEAQRGSLVFLAIDEADALFSVRRGDGWQDGGTMVRQGLVTQLNAEMDGIEELNGVVVFLLTNRPDILDPSVIRPGRFDLKVYVSRPNQEAAGDIFSKYLYVGPRKPGEEKLPLHGQYFDPANYEGENYFPRLAQPGERRQLKNGQKASYPLNRDPERIIEYFIQKATGRCYDKHRPENCLLKVIFADGAVELFTLADFMSGAVIANMVRKAYKLARNRYLAANQEERTGEGLRLADIYQAVEMVVKGEQFLPMTRENMQRWLYTEGKPVKTIKEIVPLLNKEDLEPERPTSQKMI